MPSTTFNTRTYSRKSKRKAEEPNSDAKRRKLDMDDEDEVATDVEDQHDIPQRAPRDLTHIFDSLTPSATASTSPGKLAKRMLSRSRTESSIASGSGSSLDSIARAPSLASPSSQPAEPKTKQSPIPRTKSAGRTYAGASRSFLVPIPINPAALGQLQEDLDDEFASRESYTSLRTRWGVDQSEDDPFMYGSPTKSGSNASTPNASPTKKGKGKARPDITVPSMMNPLKSITEMRNRGESRRLLDEVGYLWEGLDPSAGIGLRRSSALEINTKLCDSDFARKAKTADFIGQTWEFLLEANREEDKVMNILLAFFCALVARDPGSLVELVQRDSSQVVQTLFALLASFPPKSDPLHLVSDANQLRKLGLSKKEQNLAASIHSMLRSSALFPPFTPLSTALLVSHTLASLPSASLKPTPANLKAILDNLREHFSSFSPSLSAFVTISQHSEKQNALAHLHNLLSLFDSYLLRGWALQAEGDININQQQLEAARTDWFADGLTSFAILTEVISSRSATSEVEQGKARQCTLVTLRLLVGLTHADKIWCGKVASREECLLFIMRTILRGHVDHMEKVKKHQSSKIKTEPSSSDDFPRLDNSYQEPTMPKDDGLDALCLALGLLTNLVQLEDEVKTTIRDITSSTRCRPTKCLEKCLCPNRISAPRALVEMYTDLVLTSSAPVKQEPCLDSGQQTDLLAAGETRLLLSHLSLLFGLLMKDNSTNQRDILDWLPESPTSLACDGQSGKVQMLIAHAKEFSYLYAESGDEGGSARDVIVFLEQLQNQL